MIRIIGGTYRSRQITVPDLEGVRPTQDRVREAVFSALGTSICNSSVLDLFAGSGAYGFEAISRGAKDATFNDINQSCLNAIRDTSTKLKCTDKVNIVKGDYKKTLLKLAKDNKKFNVIFLDPPYAEDINKDVILSSKDTLLANCGIVVAEQETPLEEIEGFLLKTYKYSYKRVGIYRKVD